MSEKKILPNASVGSSAESSFKSPEVTRRGFFSWLSLGWVAYIGVTGVFHNDRSFFVPKCTI